MDDDEIKIQKEKNTNIKQTLFTNLQNSNTLFKTLYSWESPDRVWKEKDKLWYASYTLFFIVIIAISIILGYYLLVVAILAFAFMWFLQASTKPIIIENKITTTGIRTAGFLIRWREIKHFWFSIKEDHVLLQIDYQKEGFKELVNRISIICNDHLENVYNILKEYCDYGDKDEINYNFIASIICGEYIDESKFENLNSQDSLDKNE